jgi:hypothetical protein
MEGLKVCHKNKDAVIYLLDALSSNAVLSIERNCSMSRAKRGFLARIIQ